MAPAPLRSRTVSCKVTEEEYERLVAAADRAKKSVGEWCREALVERTQGREPTAVEQAVRCCPCAPSSCDGKGPRFWGTETRRLSRNRPRSSSQRNTAPENKERGCVERHPRSSAGCYPRPGGHWPGERPEARWRAG